MEPIDASGKADLVNRFLARFLDGLVAVAASAFLALLLPGFFGDLVGALAAAAYVLFSDGLTGVPYMRRRSLGKAVMGLRPQRAGRPMDLEASARRNAPLAVGYLSVLPFVGWLLMLAGLGLTAYEVYRVVNDPQGRRWGDDLAGTQVAEAPRAFGSGARPGTRR